MAIHVFNGGGTQIHPVENILHDPLTAWVLNKTSLADNRVVVVDIDEASLKDLGRWPWSRDQVSALFATLLQHYQVSLIGSDILFVDSTKEDSAPLAQVLADPRILNALVWSPFSSERRGEFGSGASNVQVKSDSSADIPIADGWLAPGFLKPSSHVAHISPVVSEDGLVRQLAPIVCSRQMECMESLPLGLYRMLLGEKPQYVLENKTWYLKSTASLPVGAVEAHGFSWVSWTGYAKADMYVSAKDVLSQRVDLNQLRGKVVIVGSTATGLYDQISTPFSPSYPAVEVHRNQLSALLEGRLDSTADQSRLLELAVGLVVVAFIWIGFASERLALGVLASTLVVAAWLLWIVQARFDHQYWSWAVLFSIWFAYSLLMLALRPLLEKRKRLLLVERFGAYVAPQVLQRLQAEDGVTQAQTHQRCEMSVLFADVIGYTPYSETVEPTELARVTRLLMNELTRIVLKHEGTVDKYMGDSIMAFWGAPVVQEGHAEKAFLAGVEMYQTIRRLNQENILTGLEIGVGVNTGEAVVGDMGSDFRYDYSVIGASVNLASYFEEGTRETPFNIIIGEATYRASPSAQGMKSQSVSIQIKNLKIPAHGYVV